MRSSQLTRAIGERQSGQRPAAVAAGCDLHFETRFEVLIVNQQAPRIAANRLVTHKSPVDIDLTAH
jgi:hypothetical protein